MQPGLQSKPRCSSLAPHITTHKPPVTRQGLICYNKWNEQVATPGAVP